jgi:protein-L-isoaspartate(D-aspartate) O-methyltransferase
VSVVAGPLTAGAPSGGPFDVIIIEGAVSDIPPAIARQLRAETGRLVTVLRSAAPGGPGRVGQAVLAEVSPAGLRAQPMFDSATPLLPAFVAAPVFEF